MWSWVFGGQSHTSSASPDWIGINRNIVVHLFLFLHHIVKLRVEDSCKYVEDIYTQIYTYMYASFCYSSISRTTTFPKKSHGSTKPGSQEKNGPDTERGTWRRPIWMDRIKKLWSSGNRHMAIWATKGGHLEDHPMTCTWLITIVSKSPKGYSPAKWAKWLINGSS